MLTVMVSMQAREDRVDRFVEAIRENAAASLRDEPGCLRFDIHRQLEDPTRFVLHEVYADEAAFHEGHRTAPHYLAFRALTGELLVAGSHVTTLCTPVQLTAESR